MAQTQISPEQRQSVLRLKHIFQNNIGIVKDYYQQIKDGNNNPSLDRGMLQEILSSEKDSPSYDDLNRFAKYVAYSSSAAGKAGIRSGYFAELIDKNIDVGKNLLDRKDLDLEMYPTFNLPGENTVDRAGKSYDLTERGFSTDDLDIGTMENITYGVTSGLLKVGEGIGETVAMVRDKSTDYRSNALEEFQQNYPKIDVDGFLGKSAELITQYGTGYKIVSDILQAGTKKVLSKSAKEAAEKIQKKNWKKRVLQIGAPAAISEPFVSTSRDVTLLQAFGIYDKLGITQLINKLGIETVDPNDPSLSKKEKAAALLKHKLLFGLEGIPTVGGLAVGLPYGLKGIWNTITTKIKDVPMIGKYAEEVLPKVVAESSIGNVPFRATGKIYDAASNIITSERSYVPPALRFLKKGYEKAVQSYPLNRIPSFEDWRLYDVTRTGRLGESTVGVLNKIRSFLSTSGVFTKEGTASARFWEGQVDKIERSMLGNFEIISNRMHQIANEMSYIGRESSEFVQRTLNEDFRYFILNPKASSEMLPRGTRLAAKRIRRELLNLKKTYGQLRDNANLNALDDAFLKDADEYLTLSFKILRKGTGSVSSEAIRNMRKWTVDRLKNTEVYKNTDEKTLRDIAGKRVEDLMNLSKNEKNPARLIELAESSLRSQKLLKEGETFPDVVNKLYGKTEDLRNNIIDTTLELANAVTKKQFVDEFASLGKNKFLFDDAEGLIKTRNITTPLKQINLPYYADLEVGKAINGKYTTEAMADALKNMSLFTDSWITNPYYRGFLAMKSYAQIAKTVLSPITQVRNVTSAAGFALANGHVGGGASLREAVDYILKDLFIKNGTFDREALEKVMGKLTEQKLVNSNLFVKELELLAKDATRSIDQKKIDLGTEALINFLTKSPVMKKATRLYQAGDDIWKAYGFFFETNRLPLAFMKKNSKGELDLATSFGEIIRYHEEVLGKRFDVQSFLNRTIKQDAKLSDLTEEALDKAIEDIAGSIIRNTYPNYNYVPSAIQNLRRMPIGNFVSFPAEMIRTSTNLLKFASREMLSSNPMIRQNGAKRLLGFATVAYAVDKGFEQIGKWSTDTTQEQLDALQNTYTPTWNQNGRLMVVKNEKDAKGDTIYEYIPTSYQNAYTSTIGVPFYTIMNNVAQEKRTGDDELTMAVIEGFAPLFETFGDPNLFTEAVLDVTLRGGVTANGKEVYFKGSKDYPGDSVGDRAMKSFVHITTGPLLPGAATQGANIYKGLSNEFNDAHKNQFYTNLTEAYKLSDEMLGLLGIRKYKVNINESFQKFELGKFTKALQLSREQMSGGDKLDKGIYNPNNSSQDILDAFYDYQIRNYRHFSRLNVAIEDAETLGVEKYKLFQYMEGRQGITLDDINSFQSGSSYIREDGKTKTASYGIFNPGKIPSIEEFSRFQEQADKKALTDRTGKGVTVFDIVPMDKLEKMYFDFQGLPLNLTNKEIEDYFKDVEVMGRQEARYKLIYPQLADKIDAKYYSKKEENIGPISEIQPIIPITPPQTTAATPQVATSAVPGTDQGLTSTEMALLSPEEQLIKLRQKGVA
jgi:hypothetical protein